jgi:hypothetical protein
MLNDVAIWLEANVFSVLRKSKDPESGIKEIFEAVDRYFYSGSRIGLVYAFASDGARGQFSTEVCAYFASLSKAFTVALKRNGFTEGEARDSAEYIVAGIQRALLLARSQDDPKILTQTLQQLQNRVLVNSRE